MNSKIILGIDLGGTNVRGGWVKGNEVKDILSQRVMATAGAAEVLEEFLQFTDRLMHSSVGGIGIGVPGLVLNGIVYDVVNIPSWKEIPLQTLMQERYQVPVVINNDANCFALGEFHFGKGKGCNSMIGVTVGTGLGSGIIINKKLFEGANGGAGEFGMINYLEHTHEWYASGQFFENVYGIGGETVFKKAGEGDATSLRMYEEMGFHLGNALKTIMYALDVELIVLGGSVRKAFPYFSKTLWEQLRTFEFKRSVKRLRIDVSELENSGILGAAALCLDS